MQSQTPRPLVVVFASPVEASLAASVRAIPGVEVEECAASDSESLERAALRAGLLVTRSWQRVDGPLLERAVRAGLRAIVQGSSGRDNIDVDAARALGVRVEFADPGNATAVAELTLLSLLMLFREPRRRWQEGAKGPWPDRESVADRELRGKTLGLVGLGRVGGRVARRAAAFEMRVSAVDPYIEEEAFERAGARRVGALAELLPACDALSLHCPLTSETRGLVGAAALRSLPRGAFVLNTARGGVVVERELRRALDEGQVGAAVLDVFEEEPPRAGGIQEHPRVLATPHIAGHTAESHEAREREMRETIRRLVEELQGARGRNARPETR